MEMNYSKGSNSDKLYELACELEQSSVEDKYDLSKLREELLGGIIECFMANDELKKTSKNQKTIQLYVSIYSPDYNKIAKPRDNLYASGGLQSFENEYEIYLKFIANTDRDGYGEPRYKGVLITWDYKEYLKKCKQNQRPKEKVLSRFKEPKNL